MTPDNYESRTFIFPYQLEKYISYLQEMGASEEKIKEMTKNIVVIKLEVNNA